MNTIERFFFFFFFKRDSSEKSTIFIHYSSSSSSDHLKDGPTRSKQRDFTRVVELFVVGKKKNEKKREHLFVVCFERERERSPFFKSIQVVGVLGVVSDFRLSF